MVREQNATNKVAVKKKTLTKLQPGYSFSSQRYCGQPEVLYFSQCWWKTTFGLRYKNEW